MARGNGGQVVRNDHDRQRLLDGLARAVQRCSWRVYAFDSGTDSVISSGR